MRLAIGQLWQETNTFNRNPTRAADFDNWGVATGADVLARFGTVGEIGGFVSAVQAWRPDAELVGLARYACWPWGRVDAATWRQIQDAFVTNLQAAGKVDGVLLALHGAMAAEGEPDVTGALLALVRKTVGPDVPIAGSLDLHANITRQLLTAPDSFAGYLACPHLDSFETGQRAVRGLQFRLETGRPVHAYWRKLPLITAAESHNTFTGPPAKFYRQLEALEKQPGVLSAGLYMAMPWFDCPELGWTITLHTETADPKWQKAVDDLAAECWDHRAAMSDIERFSPAEVVEEALQTPGHPVVIGDGADATNSGSPGDNTVLLREFLKHQPIPHGALTFLVDPEAVAHAQQVGVGGAFDTFVGASYSPEYSDPLRFRGTVERLLDVKFTLDGHIGKNLPISMGRGAVVRSGDVTVLFVEKSGPGSTPLLYEAAGLQPRTAGIVVAKSPSGFRAEYEPFAARILLSDCPGCATPNWPRLKFIHAHRPLWPLEEIDEPAAAGWCGSSAT